MTESRVRQAPRCQRLVLPLVLSLILAVMAPAQLTQAQTESESADDELGQIGGAAEASFGASRSDCVASRPLATRLGQMLLLGTTRPADATDHLREGRLSGVVVLGNDQPTDLGNRISELRQVSAIQPFFAIDEEGGPVQRLAGLLGKLPAAADIAATASPAEARSIISDHTVKVGELGFDVVLGPVADVGGGPGIGERAFSSEPETVSAYVAEYRRGIRDAGLLPVVKHFPGHGRASGDSHLGLPSTPGIAELRAQDLVPFEEAIADGAAAIMVGHLVVPGLTGDDPASLSTDAITGLLRTELGHQGLVISDGLGMGAITDQMTQSEAAVRAIIAGTDLALLEDVNAVEPAIIMLEQAVADGRLPESQVNQSVLRVLEAKDWPICSGAPLGMIEGVAITPDGLSVTGWATEVGTPAPVEVQLVIDRLILRTVLADERREDLVAALGPGATLSGWTAQIKLPPGQHEVCAELPNTGIGRNQPLGCQVVTG